MLNDVVSKFGRNFDQTSTPQVSKFGRSLVSQFGRHFIKWITYFIDIPSKLRPNLDTPSVEVWSKFGRSFDTGGVEVWPKFRPNFDPPVSKFGLIDDDRNNQTMFVCLKEIVYFVCIK